MEGTRYIDAPKRGSNRTERLARALRRSGTTTIDDAIDVIDDTGDDGEVGGGMVSEAIEGGE